MPEDYFFKFPSTPHIIFSDETMSRSDKLLPENQKNLLLSNWVTIEEKIDGANLGISFDKDGELVLQNRGQRLLKPYLGQWEKMGLWVSGYLDRLFDVLEDKYILFGEWCYAKHSLFYSELPNLFIAFDIYDKKSKKFFSVERRNNVVERIGLPIVPCIKQGHFVLEDIPLLLRKSAYGDCNGEGLYFRFDLDGWLNVRAKYVRESFSQTIEQHWKSAPILKNIVTMQTNL